ncbi:MAG TPA: type II toxin-antitoxin system HicB family antitoxin [Bacteroidia bacterium]|jgi:predicted RNase H-like HicB family nuclease|nr:type II toxin-antitoxin system HicB family antitoxin [Bacteroidia bacterium]
MKKKLYNLTVVIEQDEEGKFLAICPALQGCYTEGETVEEALTLIKDAMKLHIEDRLENNEPIYEEVKTEKLSIAV